MTDSSKGRHRVALTIVAVWSAENKPNDQATAPAGRPPAPPDTAAGNGRRAKKRSDWNVRVIEDG
jgi:hypothetical protein